MAGGKAPGPTGSSKTKTMIDIGTQCLQSSSIPGTLFGLPDNISITSVRFCQKILIGQSKRKVDYNFDRTDAEDMTFGKKPPKSSKIQKDDLFGKTDKELIEEFSGLVKWTSTGDMQGVALEMAKDAFLGV